MTTTPYLEIALRQYSTSPKLIALLDAVKNQNDVAFVDVMKLLELQTGVGATGVFLDWLSAKFDLNRATLTLYTTDNYFGFSGDDRAVNFDQKPFFGTSAQAGEGTPVSDDIQLKFLKIRATAVFGNTSFEQIDQIIKRLFGASSGLFDNQNMTAIIRMVTDINDAEVMYIIDNNLVPRPTGVKYSVYVLSDQYFGFAGDDNARNFDNKPFARILNL